MNIGIIGLGRMGNAIAQRLIDADYPVIGYDRDPAAMVVAKEVGIQTVESIESVIRQAKVIWLLLPAGDAVDEVLKKLMPEIGPGDVIVDGGNSNFKDSVRRAQMLTAFDASFIDCGVSGGLQGRGYGFCLTVGGDQAAYIKVHGMLTAVATPGGVGHIGGSGAGHYTKMVHNAIEYALLEAYGEGFQLLRQGSFASEALDFEEISRLWNHGSIIRSWILDLAHRIFERDQKFEDISGVVGGGQTGRWAVEDAEEHKVPVPVIHKSLKVRDRSHETGGTYATKLVALLRHEFGGHPVKKKDE